MSKRYKFVRAIKKITDKKLDEKLEDFITKYPGFEFTGEIDDILLVGVRDPITPEHKAQLNEIFNTTTIKKKYVICIFYPL